MAGRIGQAGSAGISAAEVAAAGAVSGGDVDAIEAGSGALNASRTARPKSLDMGALDLAGRLNAALDASATTDATTTTTASTSATTTPAGGAAAALDAKVAALPRGPLRENMLNGFESDLRGRVTTEETRGILRMLGNLTPPEWVTMIDRLKTLPSDEKGLSLLDKFVKYGVNDRNSFIESFADQANQNLGLGVPTKWKLSEENEAEGMRPRKAERVAGRELREQSSIVLDYFNAKDRQGFVNGLRAGLEDTGRVAANIAFFPFLLLINGPPGSVG